MHFYEFEIACIFITLRLRAFKYFPKLFFSRVLPPTRVFLLLQERLQEVKGSFLHSHFPPATWDSKA